MTSPYTQSVVDGEIKRLSVSSITTYDPSAQGGCNRRWWFRYVARIAEPDTQAFARGRDIHSQIEGYLNGSIASSQLSPLIRSGLHLLPKPSASLLLEEPVDHILTADDVPLVGRVDCVNLTRECIADDGEILEGQPIEILDWKTTSDLRYAKTAQELSHNIQMVGYGVWASRLFEGVEEVRLSHVYFQTKGAQKSKKTTGIFPLAKLKERWHLVDETVSQMKLTARAESAEEVTPNLSACDAYKGCPYRNICPRSKSESLAEIFGGSMSLLDRLNGLKKPATPLATQDPTQTIVAVAPKKEDLIAQLKEQETAKPSSVTCDCGDSFFTTAIAAHQSNCAAHKQHLPNPTTERRGHDPLAAIVRGATLEQALTPTINAPDAVKIEGPNAAIPIPSDVLPNMPASIQEANKAFIAETPIEPTKRKPGRPAKAGFTQPTQAAEPVQGGLILLVDCVSAQPLATLDVYAAQIIKQVETDHNVYDLRCAPKDSSLAFGGWKGALASAVKENPPQDNTYTFDTRGNEAREVIADALRSLCVLWVRGL